MSKTSWKLPELSVFFPAYNEAGNIAEMIKQARQFLPTVAEKFEIIVINDGSTDSTAAIAQRQAVNYPQVRVISQKNRGYGGALKRGFKEAKYQWLFFTDSDLQFDIKELKRFINFTAKYPVIIGYRKNRAEGWRRTIFTWLLKIWNRVWLGFPRRIIDIDCAFKLMHRSAIKTIEPLFSDGAMVSTELLLKVHLAHMPIKQLGVRHYRRHSGQPTGNQLKVIWRAVKDTFTLKYRLAKQSWRKTQFKQLDFSRVEKSA